MKNQFDNEIKYKLFRSVREVLHPTISKKNISDYRIIISENILLLTVCISMRPAIAGSLLNGTVISERAGSISALPQNKLLVMMKVW